MNLFKKTIFLLTLSLPLSAYSLDVGGLQLGVGPKLGFGFNKAAIGSTGSARFGFGWSVGAVSVLNLDSFAFELGLQYSQRKFSFKDLAGLSGDFAATLSQFEIPLLAYYRYTVNDQLALRGGLGPQFSFAVGKVKGDGGSIAYSDAGLSKTETSLLLDLGADWKMDAQGTLAMDLRYSMGLNNRAKSSGQIFTDKFKTQYIDLSVAYLF